VELRVPFLDLDYMAAAEALPPNLRVRGATRKYIHKRAVRKWIPKEIVNRQKRGFQTPIDGWLRKAFVPFFRETVLAADSASSELFSRSIMETMLADHVAGRADFQRHLFGLLVFELWHRQFVAKVTTDDLATASA
jgi:asparagine synthase (glutamine-hydrolysing)